MSEKQRYLENLKAQWHSQKASILRVRKTRQTIKEVKEKIERAERAYDLNRAVDLRYGELPRLEQELLLEQEQLGKLQGETQVSPSYPKRDGLATATVSSNLNSAQSISRIFISYRREDGIAYAGRLSDLLASRFGEQQIFMDIDAMRAGLDFVAQIEKEVQACAVLIAVIGKTWVSIEDEDGNRRLDNPEDFVQLEIQATLLRDIPVIPLLVGGARMPKPTSACS